VDFHREDASKQLANEISLVVDRDDDESVSNPVCRSGRAFDGTFSVSLTR
jgi:hypothetical protein